MVLRKLRLKTGSSTPAHGGTPGSGTANRGTRTAPLDATKIGNTCGRLPPRVSRAIHLRIPWLLAFHPCPNSGEPFVAVDPSALKPAWK
jgi:hypothetical protein